MSTLSEELKLDRYADMSDAEAAADLNTARIAVRQPVSVPALNSYLLESGLWRKLNEIADETDQSGPTDAARGADTVLAASVAPPSTVDLDSAGLSGSLDTLVDADAITAEERSGIDALADETISRAEQLGIGRVREGEVASARREIGGS